ncbi:MAG TPA: hypothetical protein VN175_12360 [Rhizomicrobium sp.]|nr:hypothetical protein [Rhizomicrobium sp.]
MHGFKSVVAAVVVAAMFGSSAFAADSALVAGKPAGVKSAQQIGTGTLIIAGATAAVLTAVAIVVSNQSGDRSAPNTFAPPSTTSSAP